MQDMLDSFDHVVVVMLENRSFDNIPGRLYPDGVPDSAPPGEIFNGVIGKELKNPIPSDAPNNPDRKKYIPLDATDDYHQPFPDPGEDYSHVNTQLFNTINSENFNLPPGNGPSTRRAWTASLEIISKTLPEIRSTENLSLRNELFGLAAEQDHTKAQAELDGISDILPWLERPGSQQHGGFNHNY